MAELSNMYWSDLVGNLKPYIPGEQPKRLSVETPLIKLNTNENPYPPSPKALTALNADAFSQLRLYPDPNSEALKTALAQQCGVAQDHIFVGNGSDEVLAHIFCALLKKPKPLLYPDITYSFYPVYCRLYQIEGDTIPLETDFSININHYARGNGGIIFANPNAPTGRLLALDQIKQLLLQQHQLNPGSVVVVDEAYIDFGGESALSLVTQHPNLLVVQTFSKSRSLAGMRVGFAVGQPHLIEGLERVKNSFNSYPIDRITEQVAIAALEDHDYFQKSCKEIINTRAQFVSALEARGFEVIPSSANFVMAKPPENLLEGSAAALSVALRQANILVRYFNSPRIDQYLRITVGLPGEMDKLIAVLDRLLSE